MNEGKLIPPQNCTQPPILRLDEDDIGVIRPKKKGLNKKIIDEEDE
jgi:hypothetical protein